MSPSPPTRGNAQGQRPETPALTPSGGRGSALIVDDDPISRRLLSLLLQREGFATLEARDGQEALALYERTRPDIVFMDVAMPGMDGLETTRRIKSLHVADFVPVIFLSASHAEDSMVSAIQAGGDDYLTKPFDPGIIRARVLAMERLRDLQRRLVAENVSQAELLEREREEQALAERVFSRAINNRNVATDRIGLVQRPAAMFSGDLVLTQHLPDGGLRVLIGDFTGHGLAAAIGALPVAEAFHAMTQKGVEDSEVLAEINRKLHQLLPRDRFMAACLLSIPGRGEELHWWNGGMPGVWLRQRDGLIELPSFALPLGVLRDLSDADPPRRVGLRPGDGLLAYSDGLTEARNAAGIPFDAAGFRPVLARWSHAQAVLPALMQTLDAHCRGAEQSDDIAILEIPLNATLFAAPRVDRHCAMETGWRWSLTLRDEHLGGLRSLDAMLRPLGLLNGLDTHLVALETVVVELYSNALEHGILRLSSSLKDAPDGFEVYYGQREAALNAGCQGQIELEIEYRPLPAGGSMTIRLRDSGEGFDDRGWQGATPAPARPWGRGIALVRELCESLTYRESGRLVEAVYRW